MFQLQRYTGGDQHETRVYMYVLCSGDELWNDQEPIVVDLWQCAVTNYLHRKAVELDILEMFTSAAWGP